MQPLRPEFPPHRSSSAHRRRPLVAVAGAVLLTLAAGACSSANDNQTGTPVGTSPGTAPTGTAPTGTGAEQLTAIRVLVSNDDGVAAEGIDTMVEALRGEPNVTVVVSAPATNQSGTGGKTTPGTVVTTTTTTKSGYPATSVEGFPADSVVWALDHPQGGAPDLVISGVNAGQNLGPVVDLSGTVGAARAAASRGIPAVAVSAGTAAQPNFGGAATTVIEWLRAHRAAVAAHQLKASVTSFNEPSCTAGTVRGLVQVPAATDAAGRNVIGPSDCTSTVADPADDVDAFINGFATESELPLAPAA